MMNALFPSASRLVYGCMGLGGDWDQSSPTSAHVTQARAVIDSALDNNITVFDHADIYTFGKAETVFGAALKEAPTLRDKMVLQSKCAIRFEDELGPKRYDFSKQWITSSVENSLSRLHTDYLDILLLHRPDPLMEVDDVCEALSALKQDGKIKQVGVSNMHGHQIAYLQHALDMPVVANQIEMSLAFRDWVEDGMTTGSLENRSMGFAPGTLEYCMQNNIQLQAWGSLAQGRFSGGKFQQDNDKAVAALVSTLAAEYQTTSEAIVLGWLMRHPANIQPVIGTTNPSRIDACAKACDISLSREHWYALLEAARGQEVP